MKNLLLTFCTILTIQISFSQSDNSFFGDIEEKEGLINDAVKFENSIIVTGLIFETNRKQANLMRVDTNGVVLWQTVSDPNQNVVADLYGFKNIRLGIDNFIYTTLKGETAAEIWKVDPNDGTVIWKKLLSQVLDKEIEKILDYDGSRILVSYSTAYNGYVDTRKIALINKIDGTFVEYELGDFPWQSYGYSITTDFTGNVYYSNSDSIIKLDGANLATSIFRQRINSVAIRNFTSLNYDETTNSLLGVAYRTNQATSLFKFDGNTGSIMTQQNLLGIDNPSSCVSKMKNGKLFYSINGINDAIIKYDIELGEPDWSYSTFPWPSSTGIKSNYAFDIDDDGNIFATGNYAGGSTNHGKWHVLKLSPMGNLLYFNTIERDTTYDDGNIGTTAFVIQNKPCFAGLFESRFQYGFSTPYFIRIENTTGLVEKKEQIGGKSTKFASDGVNISSYIDNKTLLLKKEGRVPILECYDNEMNRIWRKSISQDSQFYIPHSVSYTPNGDIYVLSLCYQVAQSSPFYTVSEPDIYIHKLNSSGSILNFWYFSELNQSNVNPLFMRHDGTQLIIGYNVNGVLYLRTLKGTALSSSGKNTNAPTSTIANFFPYVDIDDVNGYLVRKHNTSGKVEVTRIYKYNTLSVSSSQTFELIPSSENVSSIQRADTLNANELLIAGRTSSNRDFVTRYIRSTNLSSWTYVSSTVTSNYNLIKTVIDPGQNFVYTLSSKTISTLGGDIIVKKIDINTGILIWEFVYNGAANGNDTGSDMILDTINGQIVICGSEGLASFNSYPLIVKLNLQGTLIESYTIPNEVDSRSVANRILALPNGQTWTVGNINTSFYGKTGFVSEHLTMCVDDTTSLVEMSCETFDYNNVTYINTGVYYIPFQNSLGCDSIVKLDLTILQPDSTSIIESACTSFLYNGVDYTSSGTYYVPFQNNQGCDSIVELDLTILQPDSTSIIESACTSFLYNGVDYASSGTYYVPFQNSLGCDSIVELDLTILQPDSTSIIESACTSFLYNGVDYTSSGTYYVPFQNSLGCDSIVELDLTILQPDSTNLIESACTSFLYNGVDYASSGTYYVPFQNSLGCDSIVELDLTILQPDSTSIIESACTSFLYNGVDYTSSGTYYVLFQNSLGCDSIVELDLTINGYEEVENVHAVNTYFWQQSGISYTQSGTYYDTVSTLNFCDSIFVLNLDISNFIVNTFTEPSDIQVCNGVVYITAEENPSFTFDIGSSSSIISLTGNASFNSLCPGLYSLQAIDNNNDTLNSIFVIPSETQYILNNIYSQTQVLDSLGAIVENCDIDYQTIDTVYILSTTIGLNDTVYIDWAIEDVNGITIIPAVYVLNSGNGSYFLQLQLYCPFKGIGDYFVVTQSVNYQNGNVGILNLVESTINEVIIFPNPTEDKITLLFDEPNLHVTLMDLMGKRLKSYVIQSGQSISLKEYSSGVYLVELQSGNQKMIKQLIRK